MLRRISIGVAVAALLSSQSLAQQAPGTQNNRSLCGNRAEIAERLAGKYKERPFHLGVTSEGKLLEVFASPTGTWTMLMTRPDGQSCLVIHGEGWKALARMQAKPQMSEEETPDDSH